MGLTLYEIDKQIEEVLEGAVDPETGEVNEEALEAYDALQMEREEKCVNIALFIRNLNSDLEAIKAEQKRFTDLKARTTKKIESLSKYLEWALQGDKIKTPQVQVTYRASSSVEFGDDFDIRNLPEQFVKTTKEPSKAEIKAALKNGETVPGCTLEQHINMIVK